MFDWLIRLLSGLLLTPFVLYLLFLLPFLKAQIPTLPGPFSISIERNALNEEDEALIAAAENICPDPQFLSWQCEDDVVPDGTCQWWCGEYYGVRVPVGITADTWHYFQDFVTQLQQDAEAGRLGRASSASFKYSAEVRHPDIFWQSEIAHEVTLRIEWEYNCGGFDCGFVFNMRRDVYFDKDKNVIEVSGDGLPSIPVH